MSKPKRERRVWTPARKMQVVLEAMASDARVAEICRREGLSPQIDILSEKPNRSAVHDRTQPIVSVSDVRGCDSLTF